METKMDKNLHTISDIDDVDSSQYGFLFHYYRAEVYRETNWRNRLDTTTNWSIVVTAAILSYSFSNPGSSHAIILLNYLAVMFFLYIESHRFRYYNLLRTRVRFMEQYLIAEILDPKKPIGAIGWRTKLSESLRVPKITLGKTEALAWRIRRTYIFIIFMVVFAWVAKIIGHTKVTSFMEFVDNATFLGIPGFLVFGAVAVSTIWFFLIGYYIPKNSPMDDLP